MTEAHSVIHRTPYRQAGAQCAPLLDSDAARAWDVLLWRTTAANPASWS